MNEAYNVDCLEYMKTLPDKFFDLAVVDPPYGGGADPNGVGLRFHGGDRWDKYKLSGESDGGTVCTVRNAENRGYL